MKKLSAYAFVLLLLFTTSCQDNDTGNPPPPAAEDFIFDGTVAGTQKTIKGSAGGYPGSGYNGWDPELGITYGISIENLTTNEQVDADMGVFSSAVLLDTAAWKNFFYVGRTFSLASGADPGAVVLYTPDGSTHYRSDNGSQSGSTFKIDSRELVATPGDVDNMTMKIKVSFNCKVYDNNGLNPIQINGYLAGAFDYYP